MSILKGFRHNYGTYGLLGLFLAAKSRLIGNPIPITVCAPGIIHPFQLRVRTTDGFVYKEVILGRQYDVNLPFTPKIIIDAGANIGLASIFYANKYPSAKIVAIEPDPQNFAMLRKNVAVYPNIVTMNAALWNCDGQISLHHPGVSMAAAVQVTEKGQGYATVPAVTLETIMAQYGLEQVDLLKVDIEGAEKEVFDSCSAWIGKIGAIIIELHDRFKPGCRRSLSLATPAFREECRGDLTILVRDSSSEGGVS
jgi:FkbM family methyltransferase